MTFSFSEAQDAEYAIGWPHVRRITDGRGTVERGVKAATRLLGAVDAPWIRERTVATCRAYVRGWDVSPRGTPTEAAARMASDEPLDAEAIDALIAAWMRTGRYWFQVEELVLAVEALTSSDEAGARFAAYFAKQGLGPKRGALGSFFGSAMTDVRHATLFCLGFVALRSPATRDALEGLRSEGAGFGRVVLDLVLDGADACARHGVAHLFGAIFAEDPDYLRGFVSTERYHSSLTPRFAYLGGEPLLAHYVQRARDRGVPPYAAARFVEQFGSIRHPLTIELMGVLAAKKKTAKAAIAWLCAHSTFVDEHPDARAALPSNAREALDGASPRA